MRSKLTILAMMFIALVSCNTGSETSVSFHVEDTQLYPEAVLMTKDSIYKQALTSNNSTTFTLPEKFEPAYGAMFFQLPDRVPYDNGRWGSLPFRIPFSSGICA